MSLELRDNGWKSFAGGRIWRCGPENGWRMETEGEGHYPAYSGMPAVVAKIRRIRSFYAGRISPGMLDSNGTALDILAANAMTESYGTVPSPLEYRDLRLIYENSAGLTPGDRLLDVVRHISATAKALVRREPGFINPVATPNRISLGSHHMLLSTALELTGPGTTANRVERIVELALKLPSESLFAADLAIRYMNRSHGRHRNEPPLIAASYNAGSPRPDPSNPWNLKQYGDHLGRWIAFYNTSRQLATPVPAVSVPASPPAPASTPVASSGQGSLELRVVRKTFTGRSTIGELYIDEQFHCYTLEDVVREGQPKVYGETAIPKGRYEVTLTFSNRFKKTMPLLHHVPGFEGIRIHKGNTDADSLGCILVGKAKGPDRISNCAPAYDGLVAKLNEALPAKRVFITVG